MYKKLFLLILVLIILTPSASAELLLPEEYEDNQCELIGKDFQKEYGGSLIWIQPLKSNGGYDLGEYKAHIINKVYSKEIGIYYIDYQTQTYLYSLKDVEEWYRFMNNKNSEIWDLSISRPHLDYGGIINMKIYRKTHDTGMKNQFGGYR